MPLYQYKCTGCGNIEEVLQSMEEMEKGIDSPNCCACCDHPFERIVGGASIGLCETSWWRGVRGEVMDLEDKGDKRGKILAENAKKRGISMTGKVYIGQLAKDFMDPEALVGSIHDVERLCKRRGWVFNGVKEGRLDIKIPVDFSKTLAEQIPDSELGA